MSTGILMHISNNFDGKTWLGIAGIVLLLIIFFKGMGTKEGGAGNGNGNGNGGSNGNNRRNNNTSNNVSNSTTNNNNNNGMN